MVTGLVFAYEAGRRRRLRLVRLTGISLRLYRCNMGQRGKPQNFPPTPPDRCCPSLHPPDMAHGLLSQTHHAPWATATSKTKNKKRRSSTWPRDAKSGKQHWDGTQLSLDRCNGYINTHRHTLGMTSFRNFPALSHVRDRNNKVSQQLNPIKKTSCKHFLWK